MEEKQSDSITIRITGKEIQNRLNCLDKKVARLSVSNYIQLSMLLVILGKTFFF